MSRSSDQTSIASFTQTSMLPLLAGFWFDQVAYCVAPAFIYTNVMLPLLAGFRFDQAAYCVAPAFIYTNVNAIIARRFLVWPGRLLRGSRLHLHKRHATIARRFLVWPDRLLRGSRLHLHKRQCCHCSQVSGLTRPPIAWLPPSFTHRSSLLPNSPLVWPENHRLNSRLASADYLVLHVINNSCYLWVPSLPIHLQRVLRYRPNKLNPATVRSAACLLN